MSASTHKKPYGRNLEDFETLMPAEQRLLDASRRGELAQVAASRPYSFDANNTIRASFLRFLALGGDSDNPVHETGVQVCGAWISGELNLNLAMVAGSLSCIYCQFDTQPLLIDTCIQGSLNLSGCHLPGLKADRLKCVGSVFLRADFNATDVVILSGADIGGDFGCDKAKMHGQGDANGTPTTALEASGATIKGNVFLTGGFNATGTVKLQNAQIGRDFDCSNATLIAGTGGAPNPGGRYALNAENVQICGAVYLNDNFNADGLVDFLGARIGQSINFNGANLDGGDGENSEALNLSNSTISGDVNFSPVFTTGQINLSGASLAQSLCFSGAQLNGNNDEHQISIIALNASVKGNVLFNSGFKANGSLLFVGADFRQSLIFLNAKINCENGRPSLFLNNATLTGNLMFGEGFCANGTISLSGMKVGQKLSFSGAHINVGNSEYSTALDGFGIKINGDISFSNGFKAIGSVILSDAHIGANLILKDATFNGQKSHALLAERTRVRGNAQLQAHFTAENEVVRLSGMSVEGDLNFEGASLCICSCGNSEIGQSLVAEKMRVAGALFFRQLQQPARGVSLVHSSVGQLVDEMAAWGNQLQLDGFVYGSLAGEVPTATDRLRWLDLQLPEHAGMTSKGRKLRPMPWRQLQKVFQEMGLAEEARQVVIAFRDRQIGLTPSNRKPRMKELGRIVGISLHWLYGKLIGYGYRPLKLLAWSFLVWSLCTCFYWYSALDGVFAPTNPLIFQNSAYAVCVPGSNEAKSELAKQIPAQGAGNWYLCGALREEYTGFSPMAYSLDLMLPLVELQQKHDWAPMISTPSKKWYVELFSLDLNTATRLVMWFEILFGWMASLLFVAVFSGLVKQNED